MNNFEKQKYSATFQKFSLFAFYSLENPHCSPVWISFISIFCSKTFVFYRYGVNWKFCISEVMIIKSYSWYFLSSWHPLGFHWYFPEPLSRYFHQRETLPPSPQCSLVSDPPREKVQFTPVLKSCSHLFPSNVSLSLRSLLLAWAPPTTLSRPSWTIMLWL